MLCTLVAVPQLDHVVSVKLPSMVAELSGSTLYRLSAMAACYPGGGARYVRHIDNPNNNGRKLTAILYLNPSWEPSCGGCLRVYSATDTR